MKKALSLVLAVLMLFGCVSFSAFAAAEEFYYMPDVLEKYGVETIKLTEKTTPTLDGTITPGEYTYIVNPGENVDIAGTNSLAMQTTLSEGFAYDDEHIYYYYKEDRNANSWWSDFRIQATEPSTSISSIVAKDNPFTMGTWYRFGVSGWIATQHETLVNGTKVGDDWSACGGEMAGFVGTYGNQVFEIKISRKYLDEAIGAEAGTVKAYATYLACYLNKVSEWGDVIVGTPLTGDAAATIGVSYVPRYIVLDEAENPESPNTYDVISTLLENEHDAVAVKNTDATRVIDGEIQHGEYSVTEEVAGDSRTFGAAYVDHTRYYALDDDYLYYAIKGNFHADKYVGLRIKPVTSSVPEGDLATFFGRSNNACYRAIVNSNGTVTPDTLNTNYADSSKFYSYEELKSSVGGTYDTDTGEVIIEWKINREFIENSFGADDVKAYMFYNTFYDGNIYFGDVLTAKDKADLGNFTPADTNGGVEHCPNIVLVDDRVNVVDTLAKNGVQNIYIPSTTTVNVDGNIVDGEYLVSNKIDVDVMRNDLVVEGSPFARVITEYFAYDDTYLYFAYKGDISGDETRDTTEEIRLRPSGTGVLTAEELQKNLFTCGILGSGDDYNWYQFQMLTSNNNSTTGHYRTGADTSKFYFWTDGDSSIKSNVENTSNATIEIKINRKLLNAAWGYDNTTSAYAFYYYRTSYDIWGTPLTEAMKEDLGTTQDYAPRYIILGEEATPATIDAVSIRISTLEDGTGLRFKTVVDKRRLASLQEKYGAANVTVGTLIAPLDILALDKGLTHKAGVSGVDYLDIPANVAEPFASNYNSNTYAGSITNIKQRNLGRNFAAVGYIAVDDGGEMNYYYTETAVSRNVDYVASAALADTSETQAGDYQYVVDANAATPVYSPYTEAQRAILAALLKA